MEYFQSIKYSSKAFFYYKLFFIFFFVVFLEHLRSWKIMNKILATLDQSF